MYKGTPVAVKVQRAGLKELFDTDLKNLKARRPPQHRTRCRRPPRVASTLAPSPRAHHATHHAPRHALRHAPCTMRHTLRQVLAKLLDKFDPKSDGADRSYADIYDESSKLLYEEIDYIAEGKNAKVRRPAPSPLALCYGPSTPPRAPPLRPAVRSLTPPPCMLRSASTIRSRRWASTTSRRVVSSSK